MSERSRTTRAEDLVTMGAVTWMIVGLFVDAYFHSTDPTLESFWTPWHALFYSGFTVTALWMLRLALRHGRRKAALLDRAPIGYRPAFIGLALFAAGGVGDAVWHTALGVEESIAALLSPTHLLLFAGMLLIASAPLRAAWSDHDAGTGGWLHLGPAVLSLTWTTALVAFFLEYLWLPGQLWVVEQVVDPGGGRGEEFAVLGIAGVITVTVILAIPLSLFRRRWPAAPFGVATALFGVVGIFIAVGFDDDLLGIPALVIAGLVADLLRQVRGDIAAGVAFGTLWTVVLGSVTIAGGGVGWPPEIVGGALFFGITVAAAMASLVARVDLVAVEDDRMSALSITR